MAPADDERRFFFELPKTYLCMEPCRHVGNIRQRKVHFTRNPEHATRHSLTDLGHKRIVSGQLGTLSLGLLRDPCGRAYARLDELAERVGLCATLRLLTKAGVVCEAYTMG